MGFFDRDVKNSFDRLFDLNHDGVLSPGEQAFQMDFIMKEMESNDSDDDDEEDDDDLDSFRDDFEMMDEDERRQALEDAGYDPDDFEDDF